MVASKHFVEDQHVKIVKRRKKYNKTKSTHVKKLEVAKRGIIKDNDRRWTHGKGRNMLKRLWRTYG